MKGYLCWLFDFFVLSLSLNLHVMDTTTNECALTYYLRIRTVLVDLCERSRGSWVCSNHLVELPWWMQKVYFCMKDHYIKWTEGFKLMGFYLRHRDIINKTKLGAIMPIVFFHLHAYQIFIQINEFSYNENVTFRVVYTTPNG